VLKNRKIILEVLIGDFDIEAMRSNRSLLYSDRDFHPSFNIFQDIRDANMDFTYDELFAYLQHLNESKVMAVRKTAILTTPDSVGKLSEWFEALDEAFPVNFKVFASYDDCIAWLSGGNPEPLKEAIEVLRQSPYSPYFNEPNSFTGF
jgi:hypothetical protein